MPDLDNLIGPSRDIGLDVRRTKQVVGCVKNEIVLVFTVSILHSLLSRDCGESYVAAGPIGRLPLITWPGSPRVG